MVYPNSCGADAISCDSGGTSGSSGTLQDRVSPRRGGVLILHDLFAGDGIVNGCTLGLAVRLWGVARFLTNSHCTKTKGSVDPNYLYYQGTYGNYYDLVGREWSDPAWFGCQWSSKCRRSDAAFIEFQTADYQFAKIAEPTTPNTSSITVDRFSNFTVTHEWQVPMEMPVVGKRLHRVGSSTGWTYGNVSHTCQDLRDPDGSALICQYLVATDVTSKVGDSGAPVFFIPNLAPSEDPDGAGAPRDVWIYGLHNGSTTEGLAVFSFWESIQVELGDITLQ
ncbi:MAG TPA: hypothetical protein VHG28_15700 [Longimicrobiaceae bacterium]|nr:hypothetical protein [Longimicrobiaceae bacterium]